MLQTLEKFNCRKSNYRRSEHLSPFLPQVRSYFHDWARLTPLRGKGEIEHGAARDRKIRENIDALKADLADTVSQAPGLDLVRLLDAASQYPGSRIVVLSSGLNTDAPVDMTTLGWNFDPEVVAESVHRQGLLDLAGKNITYFGIGATGGSVQPRLPVYARKLLENLWIRICQEAGATSCVVGDGEPSAAEPRSTLPVPVVSVPAAYTDGSGCPVWQRLDEAALPFTANSAVLSASADSTLQPLVDATRKCHISLIAVEGHIADTGSGSDPTNLSGRRAQVVVDRLVALGLPPNILGTVTGRGASTPAVPNLTPDGRFIESAAAQNRRVEIFLTR
ncbi:OmpA family protein [Nocardia sp. NBC_01377]|uniref:OmpA family protein n=1 Tax=Nocardia sp. NBC_01377 TaxID=2903595 RepID=UPI0032518439